MNTRLDIVPEPMSVIREKFHYNPAVRAAATIFIAGQVGRDRNLNIIQGIEAQTEQALENLKLALVTAGATFDDIVDMTTYHVDLRERDAFKRLRDRYFVSRRPAWTAVGVTALAFPGLLIEIKCTASIIR